jgi:hypothetical protein
MRKLIIAFLLLGTVPMAQQSEVITARRRSATVVNLLSHPTDISNAAWLKDNTSATNATTLVTSGTSQQHDMYQSVAISPSTTYTIAVTVSRASGSGYLILYALDSTFSNINNCADWAVNSTPTLITCTFASGANTSFYWQVAADPTDTSATFTITGATVHQ